MLKQYKMLKASHMWSVLQGHWKIYQMKAYNKRNEQGLQAGNEQEADGESSDEEDWMVHMEEANGLMDDLGEEFGMGEDC